MTEDRFAVVEERDDVGIEKLGGRSRLALEATDDRVVGDAFEHEQLERDFTPQRFLLGSVDGTESAGAKESGDDVRVGNRHPQQVTLRSRCRFDCPLGNATNSPADRMINGTVERPGDELAVALGTIKGGGLAHIPPSGPRHIRV